MRLEEKLQLLRKKNGYSQEQLADRLDISRQTIGKWENGQAVPELSSLIRLSELYGVTIDRMVKDDDVCNKNLVSSEKLDISEITEFILHAGRQTYAGKGPEVEACRMNSHDFSFQEGKYRYYDTYFGGERFIGEEAVWKDETPVWGMNYSGRVIGEHFNSSFLMEALLNMTAERPFRGPELFQSGDYSYHCKTEGGFIWFQGYEEIFYGEEKIYECYFHGGVIR